MVLWTILKPNWKSLKMLVSKNCFSQENDKTESWAWARVHLFFENVTFFEGWRCSFEVKFGQDYDRFPPPPSVWPCVHGHAFWKCCSKCLSCCVNGKNVHVINAKTHEARLLDRENEQLPAAPGPPKPPVWLFVVIWLIVTQSAAMQHWCTTWADVMRAFLADVLQLSFGEFTENH